MTQTKHRDTAQLWCLLYGDRRQKTSRSHGVVCFSSCFDIVFSSLYPSLSWSSCCSILEWSWPGFDSKCRGRLHWWSYTVYTWGGNSPPARHLSLCLSSSLPSVCWPSDAGAGSTEHPRHDFFLWAPICSAILTIPALSWLWATAQQKKWFWKPLISNVLNEATSRVNNDMKRSP